MAACAVLRDYCHLRDPKSLRGDGVLEDIAFDRARIVEGLDGADGRLLRVGNRGVIRVSASQPADRRMFTIAHELGHLELRHDGCVLAAGDTAVPRASTDEAAAHAFAAELLMPEGMIITACAGEPVGLPLAAAVAQTFRVSLVASARRIVELTPIACAVVYSQRGTVSWARRSRSFAGFVEDGRRVNLNANEVFRVVPAREWDRRAPPDAEFIEHTARMIEPEAALTLLIAQPGHPHDRIAAPDGETEPVEAPDAIT